MHVARTLVDQRRASVTTCGTVGAAGAARPWFLSAFALVLLAQAGMDVARPDPEDRTAVVVYRAVYFGLPLLLVVPVLALI